MTTTSTLAYSSSTDAGTTYLAPEFDAAPVVHDFYEDMDWCGVCARATCHLGEHDELVAAGFATYEGGRVAKTAAWDADLARTVAEAGYIAYTAGPAAYEAFCQGLEKGRAA